MDLWVDSVGVYGECFLNDTEQDDTANLYAFARCQSTFRAGKFAVYIYNVSRE